VKRLLIANRGEIALRIARAAAELDIETVGIYSSDDARSLHAPRVDRAVALEASGAVAYLDVEAVVAIAREHGCDAIHPGYGFLSERAELAARCEDAGIRFVGPTAATLRALGDKVAARRLAEEHGVPVLRASAKLRDAADARALFESLPAGSAMVIKAVSGGGGRGMRAVGRVEEIEPAMRRCQSEAEKAFGSGDLYAEQKLIGARHVEVQIAGDDSGAVAALGERDCSLQRRHQKILEIAPPPHLNDEIRRALREASRKMALALGYRSLGTFEFLVDVDRSEFYFIEANPRLQVEHTVTEETAAVDLVAAQLRLADGATLAELGLDREHAARGFALQMRINMETLDADGSVRPQSGTLTAFDLPAGAGVRNETAGYVGYTPSPNFDSLLAKLIVHSEGDDFRTAVRKSLRALRELRIEGIATNQALHDAILRAPALANYSVHTEYIDENLAELLAEQDNANSAFFDDDRRRDLAGARLDSSDPLAVLQHGKSAMASSTAAIASADLPPGTVVAPVQGTVVAVAVERGATVAAGEELLVLEAMKMEHVVAAPCGGTISEVAVGAGDTVFEGHLLIRIEPSDDQAAAEREVEDVDLDRIRPDLAEAIERHALGLDAARPESVARRRKTGHRTTRENISDLCDDGSFIEYGALVLAAQRRRRSTEELIARTPADGLVAGIGSINGEYFDQATAQCAVLSYDYTVLAGTQGLQNHRKKDRMFELAAERKLPVVLFAEGGGGRPGDTDGYGVTGLDCLAFQLFAELNGQVPTVGITTGRCFAGNAALLGCCDVVIATEGSNIGMGGPAMVEGGGLGVFRPEEIGPMAVQVANGVVDLPVADEAEAVAVAKRYLSYFQGPLAEWSAPDQRRLRHVIPENRLRIYDIRSAIEVLADEGSVLELRREFGKGMVTSLIRIEGMPLGIVANNPTHLAGAIDSDGADKAARFMQLCDAFDLPLLFLCDTPGIMVGPEVEKTALGRHAARMFVTGAGISVPFGTIVLRKGYGLGAQAMAGGSFKAPCFTVAWPTGEFGGMGLEGAVKLGFRNELAAIEDPEERNRQFQEMVDRMYQVGKAVNIASHFEIDEVIDPADSRKWIRTILTERAAPIAARKPRIDTW